MKSSNPAAHSALCGLAALLILSNSPCFGADARPSDNATNRLGETLVLLASGESRLVSYGLSCVVSGARAAAHKTPGGDLVLVLRNNGAKWIDLDHITVEDFTLQDSQGKDIKLYLRSSPRGMPYGGSEVVHLVVDHAASASQPWTLRLKAKAKALVPLELSITGIEPRRAVSSR